jgi:hypothetical protein
MTITTNFEWFGVNLYARSVCAYPYLTNIAFPTWDRHAIASYSPVSGSVGSFPTAIDDNNPTATSATGNGYISAAIDGSGARFLLTDDGRLDIANDSGSVYTQPCSPAGKIPVQIAWDGTALLVETSDGEVYTASSLSSSGGTVTYTPLGNFPAYACDMEFYNGFVYGTVASTSQLSIMGASSGTVTNASTPMIRPAAVAPSTYGDAVIGHSYSTISNPYLAILPSPAVTTVIAGIRSGSTTIDVLAGNDAGLAVSSSVTAAAQPIAAAWQSNGEQILVTESGGSVQVFNYSAGSFASSQTLTVANANDIAIMTSNAQALVSQTSSNQITVLNNNLNTWSVGSTVTGLTSPGQIVMTSATQAAVAVSGGVAILNEVAGAWSVARTVSVGYTPSSIFYDSVTGNLYVCGAASGTAHYGTIGPAVTTYTAGDSWTGSAVSVQALGNRVLVLDTTNNIARQYPSGSLTPSAEVITNALPVASTLYMSMTVSNVWFATASQSYSMNFFGKNTALLRNRLGMVSVYNEASSSWVSHSFSAEIIPTALAWDASGNLWVVTSDNNLWQFTAALSVTSTTALGEPPGQQSGVTLGVSYILYYNNALYMTTSLSGVIIVVTNL